MKNTNFDNDLKNFDFSNFSEVKENLLDEILKNYSEKKICNEN